MPERNEKSRLLWFAYFSLQIDYPWEVHILYHSFGHLFSKVLFGNIYVCVCVLIKKICKLFIKAKESVSPVDCDFFIISDLTSDADNGGWRTRIPSRDPSDGRRWNYSGCRGTLFPLLQEEADWSEWLFQSYVFQ